VKRSSLIIMVLGTAFALAPAASAMHLSDGSGGGLGSGTVPAKVTDGWMSSLTLAPTPVILHTDVLGGDGSATAPAKVTDGWMSSLTLAPTPVILHTDVLGGDGGASTRDIPAASDGDSFAWSTAAIGAVTLAGVLLLVLATTEVTRRRHRLSI
jgi:hypothetical protein